MKRYRIFIEGYYEVEAETRDEAVSQAFKHSREGTQSLREAAIPLCGMYEEDEKGVFGIFFNRKEESDG